MQFRGYYLNLRESTDRDARLRQRLLDLGQAGRYQRFEAIRGAEAAERHESSLPAGQVGCWLSHLAIWRAGRGTGEHLHVLEDDAWPSRWLAPLLEGLPELEAWDLLFTDVYFHPPPTPEQFVRLRGWRQGFVERRNLSLADLSDLPFTGTTSYVVRRQSLDKLLGLLEGGWRRNCTIDVALAQLVRERKIRALATVPFLSTLDAANVASTTGGQGPNLEALNAFREAFFIDADPALVYARRRRCDACAATEPLLGLYLELLRGVLGNLRVEGSGLGGG